jgi:hypothetical protein
MNDWPWRPGDNPGPPRHARRSRAPRPDPEPDSVCPGTPHAGHASSDWTCPLDWARDHGLAYPEGADDAPRAPLVRGTPRTATETDLAWKAADAETYRLMAEEALRLLDILDRTPGNRVIVMQRAAEMRRYLNAMKP